MAYGDYGGRVFKSGIEKPSLAEGFTSYAHAVLGDKDINVSLYKQTHFELFHDGKSFYKPNTEQLMGWHEVDPELHWKFTLYNGSVDVIFTKEDNFYQYARVENKSGDVWCGWSGYGVGLGCDKEYGFSSEDRDKKLLEFWPDAIK